MTELQILSVTKNKGGSIGYTDLLNQNLTDSNRDPSADKARIEQMIQKGLLEGRTDAFCSISITDTGRLHLQDAAYLEEQKQQLADDAARENSKNKRHDWYIAILGALFASLIGLAFDAIAYFFFK